MRYSIACTVLSVGLVLGAAAPVQSLDTIYVVRHAEKESPWPESVGTFQPLDAEGRSRAQALVPLFETVEIAAVYASETSRTVQTGAPVAQALDVPIEADNATIDPAALPEFFATLRERHAKDRAVLVVGHSNTIAMMLNALGADATCHASLGVDAEGMIDGYEGLWQIDLARTGCLGMQRRSQAEAP